MKIQVKQVMYNSMRGVNTDGPGYLSGVLETVYYKGEKYEKNQI